MDWEFSEWFDELDVEGWFSISDALAYRKLVADIHDGIIVEVGSYQGRSIISIADICRKNNNKIFCVDLWDDSFKDCPTEDLYPKFLKNIKAYGVDDLITPIRCSSVQGATHFNSQVDLVFIDADHETDSVLADIGAWEPKVKKNGIISGHDINNPKVEAAVKQRYGLDYLVDSTLWVKRKRHAIICSQTMTI